MKPNFVLQSSYIRHISKKNDDGSDVTVDYIMESDDKVTLTILNVYVKLLVLLYKLNKKIQ